MGFLSWLGDIFTSDAAVEKRDEVSARGATRPQGAAGTPIQSGWLTLPESNAALQVPDRRYKTFDNYKANVAVIATGVRYFLTLFEGIDWRVVPDDKLPGFDDAGVDDLVKEVEAVLAQMAVSVKTVARRQALARVDGFAIQVWTADRDVDGKLGIGLVQVRPPRTIERWVVDPSTRELLGVWQRDPSTGEALYIDRKRMIYSVDDQLSDAEVGTGLMRHAATDARTMGVYEGFEANGYESDMRGIPIGRAPLARLEALKNSGELSQAAFDARIAAIRKILDDHVKTGKLSIMLDSATWEDPDGSPSTVYQYDMELLRGDQGTKYTAMDAAIERRELRLARLFNIEHLFIGSSSKGGYSQSKDRSKSFGQTVSSLADQIAFDLRRDLIRPILALRGKDPNAPIKVLADATNLLDAAEAADVAWKMSQSGMVFLPDDPANNAIRARAKLPPAPKLDEAVKTSLMQASGALPPAPPPLDPNKVDESGNLRKPPVAPKTPPNAAAAAVAKLRYGLNPEADAEGAHLIAEGMTLPPVVVSVTTDGQPYPMNRFDAAYFRMVAQDGGIKAAGRARFVPGGLAYDFRDGDTALPGEYHGHFVGVDNAGQTERFPPGDGHVTIHVTPR